MFKGIKTVPIMMILFPPALVGMMLSDENVLGAK